MADTNKPEPIPRPVGTQEQRNAAVTGVDPYAEVEASPDEQAQYNQFVSRFMMALSDPKSKLGDEALKVMNDIHMTVPEAVGRATANIAFIVVQNAKAQKVNYDTEVLFHAAFECVCVVYVFGLAAGIWKDVPPFQGLQKDGTYPFNEKELHILVAAQMQAVRFFGDMEVKNGMISQQVRQANMQFWKQQIEREVKSGAVNEEVLKKLAQAGVFGHGQPPQQPQPSQSQQPQQAQQQDQVPSPAQLAQAPNPGQQQQPSPQQTSSMPPP